MNASTAGNAELQEAFEALYPYVWRLHYDWITFQTLYADSQNVAAMNETAPEFFGLEQSRLVDHLILGIARLFDPAFSGRNTTKTNLTLPAIVDLLGGHADPPVVAAVHARVTALKAMLAPLLQQRHKRIAHLDRATALGTNVLGPFQRAEFDAALSELEAIMGDVNRMLNATAVDLSNISVQAAAHANKLIFRLMVSATVDRSEWMERVGRYKQAHPQP